MVAETPHRRTSQRGSQWAAFAAGAVAMLALVLVWSALTRGEDVAGKVELAAAPRLAIPAPRLPDAPSLPHAPLPTPR